jgi:hypothetical protein
MKACTDIEQSKKLAEILPLESSDMYYFLDPTPVGNIYHLTVKRVDYGIKSLPQYDEGDIPCWSLSALLGVVSEEVSLNSFKDGDWNAMVQQNGKTIYSDADNPVDACYEMILKLHEQKIL